MVPHIRVEEAIGQTLGLGEDDLKIVVTSVPDEKKGERLVVLYTELVEPPEEICRALAAARAAAALDSFARQFPPGAGHSRSGHRQAGSQTGEGPGSDGIRVVRRRDRLDCSISAA